MMIKQFLPALIGILLLGAPAFGMEPCFICKNELPEIYQARQGNRYALCKCNHSYHLPCLHHWTLTNKTCPQCSAAIADVEIRLVQYYHNQQPTPLDVGPLLNRTRAASRRTFFLLCGCSIGAMILYYFKDDIGNLLWPTKNEETPESQEAS